MINKNERETIFFVDRYQRAMKLVRFLKKKSDVRLHAYFSTQKPELGLILQWNDSILV